MPSLGKPFVLRHSNWGSRPDTNPEAAEVANKNSAAAELTVFSCVEERTRRGSIPRASVTAQEEEVGRGKRKRVALCQPAEPDRKQRNAVGRSKREREDLSQAALSTRTVLTRSSAGASQSNSKKSRKQSNASR